MRERKKRDTFPIKEGILKGREKSTERKKIKGMHIKGLKDKIEGQNRNQERRLFPVPIIANSLNNQTKEYSG